MSRLAGKVALITGAPKGIGTATRQRIGRGRGRRSQSLTPPTGAAPKLC
jgi:hypothetical protein